MKPIKYFLLSICLITSLASYAQGSAKGIKFFTGTFSQALDEARKQHKPVFVDFFTTWCGPCKRMAREVFTQDSVGAFFNEKFVCLQLDAEKKENVDIAKQYKVDAYPTLAFIGNDGKAISVNVGVMDAGALLEAARMAVGETIGFEQLYEQYKKSPTDLAIQQQLLLKAPTFLGAQEGMEAEKWITRIRKLYNTYIEGKKGPALINKQDYLIISALGNEDKDKKTAMADFINAHLPQWKTVVGDAAAYYVIEHNDALIEDLAKAGDLKYKDCVAKINKEYKDAYAVIPQTGIAPYDKTVLYSDALYQLYKHKDAGNYIKAMNEMFNRLGDKASSTDFGKAAQDLYYAAGSKLTADQHRQAIQWVEKALQSEVSVMDRVNFLVMIGDSYRELKNYSKAREYYNQAYAESLQMAKQEAAQQMIQVAVMRKLSALELLEK